MPAMTVERARGVTPQLEGARIHLVGIGGSGMSSLARYLRGSGGQVSGFDGRASHTIERLDREGFSIASGDPEVPLPGRVDLVVRTAAVGTGHPQVAGALQRGVPVLTYAQMLGRLMERHDGIAVAGTHGKTSVAALTAFLLRECGREPSFIFGGESENLGGVGGGRGRGPHLVAEACEFARSFLQLAPWLAVITNVEEDHLDCYRDIDDLRGAFRAFAARCRPAGRLLLWHGIPRVHEIAADACSERATYGFEEDASVRAEHVRPDVSGSNFDLRMCGDPAGAFRVNLPGRHMVLNATAAVAAALWAGCERDAVRRALPAFRGVKRRIERRGGFGSITLYSDYAHHPTEIEAVVETLRAVHPGRRLVAAYQAHQRTRTAHFFDRFCGVLARFDRTLVIETFSVREQNVAHLPGGRELAAGIAQRGGRSAFIGELVAAPARIAAHLERDDVLVLMGAGDIDEIAGTLEEGLRLL